MKKRKLIRIQDIIVGSAAFFSLFLLLNAGGAFAESSVVDVVTITVPTSCSLTSTVNTAHTTAMNVGTYQSEIGETTFKVLCNDASGFSVYAIGYSDETYGNTTMIPSNLPISNAIATGTATSGSDSNWAMKLTAVSGDYAPTLTTGYDTYHAVPDEYTKVATLASNTDATIGSSFKSTYATFISAGQAADTYTGKVKYTVVHPADAATPDTLEAMQNLDSSDCTSTASQVRDLRDGRAYTIQRLLDGNCWMMENLDLGREDLTIDLTSENTNLSTTVTAATFNSWKKTTGTQTNDAGEFIPLTTSNTSNGLDADSVAGNSYGTLYNYYVASAGTVTGATNADAIYDICPAGWRLPTGGSSTGELQYLRLRYNSPTLMLAPISENGAAFTRAGTFSTNGPKEQGSYGYYWSSIKNNNTYTYFFTISKNYLSNGGAPRGNGNSIRCILKEPKTISKLLYMQDMKELSAEEKTSVIASMENNTIYELIDKRDNRTYGVAKLLDGNIWMAENLDLGRTDLATNLTSSNTNLVATVTAETFNGWKKTEGTSTYTAGELIPIDGTDSFSGTPYGTLYNYYAASAGTISGSSNSSNATYDICPAGWRLPTGGSSGEYNNLYSNYYNSTTAVRNPIASGGMALARAGYFGTGAPITPGSQSYYWTSTYYGTPVMHTLVLTDMVAPTSYTYRYYGNSIRCIAK